jgi:hypothetical protein
MCESGRTRVPGRAAPGMAQASFSTGPGLTFSLPPATMDRMSECRGAQGCARAAVPASLQAKKGAFRPL